ncbi:MAG: hypothetical protein JST93_13705 [Acidobacteria bacterium]|nr:hypothetical protein [Acidobacteriota bacterium]
MELYFTPEQEAKLARVAAMSGTGPEELVKQAAMRLLDEELSFHAAVEQGIAQLERGQYIEEEVMDARIEQMLRS